jgi:ribose transport system substrate-binding protein
MRINDALLGAIWVAGVLIPAISLAKDLKSVGVTVGDLGNPYFVQIQHGVETAAKKYNPAVKVTSLSSNYDVNTQNHQMDDLISSKVDLIILDAADPKGIAPSVIRAKKAGIAVVAVDENVEGGADAVVTSDNRQAGEEDAEYVAKRLNGHGQVVIVNGPPVPSVIDRVAGFLSVMEKYPGIKILSKDQNAGGTRDGGFRVMTDLLTSYPKIDAVFAINDPTGIGCDLAAKQAQRKDLLIVSADGSLEAAAALKDPGSLLAATAALDPFVMAEKAIEIGNDILNGKRPEQLLTLIPVQLITRENVSRYQGWSNVLLQGSRLKARGSILWASRKRDAIAQRSPKVPVVPVTVFAIESNLVLNEY